jgi:hypothetical protein
MRAVAFGIALAVVSQASAAPPLQWPWAVSGTWVTPTQVVPYEAWWSDDVQGYRFTPPNRPDGVGDVIEIDLAGNATLVGATPVFWADGVEGDTFVGPAGYAFTTHAHDDGLLFDVFRIGTITGWGFLYAMVLDIWWSIWGTFGPGRISRETANLAAD